MAALILCEWSQTSVTAVYIKWPSFTMDFLLSFCVEASRKQDLAEWQVNERGIDPLVTRLDPCTSGLPFKDQFALGEWGAVFASEEHILKRHGSVFIRKFASINIVVLVEPTFQPVTSLVQPRHIIW